MQPAYLAVSTARYVSHHGLRRSHNSCSTESSKRFRMPVLSALVGPVQCETYRVPDLFREYAKIHFGATESKRLA